MSGASPFPRSSNGMRRFRARAGARTGALSTLALAVAVGLVGFVDSGTASASASSSASSTTSPSAHNTARPLTPRPANAAPAVITGALTYHGGLVQNAPRVYVDYWGWGSDPSGEQAYLNRFLS